MEPKNKRKEHLFFDRLMERLIRASAAFVVPVVSKLDSEGATPYEVLVSTVMSARTKDETTLGASRRLFAEAGTPEKIIALGEERIAELIYPVGFYRTKARNIIALSRILMKDHDGTVPDTMDSLLTLPGVGRKTANLVLAVGLGKDGLCVDTHVHRISNRLGIIHTKTPYDTEMALRAILPKRWWETYNRFLVAWGQNVCTPISPFCSRCEIADMCERVGVGKSR